MLEKYVSVKCRPKFSQYFFRQIMNSFSTGNTRTYFIRTKIHFAKKYGM